MLLVSYTERGDKIRLISARQATKQEIKAYQEG
ncbi:BrnT family toxin [Planktothricoides sp. FACHB-1370]|uniref:BrnT family toxin n=1 Tax=Planktothricoides raciborskii FACHB-1370 TaxID=2949576 RepID=A0ABR8EIN8_9CYAN|nr:BrnT family toxin [Planktothricoides raciborskii FACHB-1370]MBD2585456.1 BrnT family toxin [Planktothricoides raciborskii FACHB-1261]